MMRESKHRNWEKTWYQLLESKKKEHASNYVHSALHVKRNIRKYIQEVGGGGVNHHKQKYSPGKKFESFWNILRECLRSQSHILEFLILFLFKEMNSPININIKVRIRRGKKWLFWFIVVFFFEVQVDNLEILSRKLTEKHYQKSILQWFHFYKSSVHREKLK